MLYRGLKNQPLHPGLEHTGDLFDLISIGPTVKEYKISMINIINYKLSYKRKRTYYRRFLSICNAGQSHFTIEERHLSTSVKGLFNYKHLETGKDCSN